MKKTLFRAISAMLCVLMLAAAFGGCTLIRRANVKRSDIFRMGKFSLLGDRDYSVGNFSYAADGVKAVEIDWVNGSIELSQSSGDTLSVSESGTDLADNQKMRWKLDGGTLRINYCKSGATTEEIAPENKRLKVELPIGARVDIQNVP